MGTIIPALGNAVFGYRPVIIGFLHLVFLGFVSFYVFFNLLDTGAFGRVREMSKLAISFFATAVVLNEAILLIEGVGLMFHVTNRLYPWLLWAASILLLAGASWILIARLKNDRSVMRLKRGNN